MHPKLLRKVLALLYPQKKCVNPFKSDRCFPGNMVPKNLFLSSFKRYKTQKVLVNIESDNNNSTSDTEETQVRLVGKYIDGLNTLGVIGMSFIFGLALRNMGETGKLLMDIISAVNEATKEVVKMIIGYTDIVPTRRPFNT